MDGIRVHTSDISFFKVDFYLTFYNYKKPINVNLPRKLEKNTSDIRMTHEYIRVTYE